MTLVNLTLKTLCVDSWKVLFNGVAYYLLELIALERELGRDWLFFFLKLIFIGQFSL